MAVTKAARDLVCELGQLSFVTSLKEEDCLSKKFLKKHGSGFTNVTEIIVYQSLNINNILAEILCN